jgi:phage tail protein X
VTQRTYVASTGDTADSIAWRVYGTQEGHVVEQLLNANKALANADTIPAGTLVLLPDLQPQAQQAGIRLWD